MKKLFLTLVGLILSVDMVLSQDNTNDIVYKNGTWSGRNIQYLSGEYLFKLTEKSDSLLIVANLRSLNFKFENATKLGLGWYLIEGPNDLVPEIEDFYKKSKNPGSYLLTPLTRDYVSYIPNDDLFIGDPSLYDSYYGAYNSPGQWYLMNTELNPLSNSIVGADSKVWKAWDLTKGDPNVIVAVFDTGISTDINGNLNHPDLSNTNRIIKGKRFIWISGQGFGNETLQNNVSEGFGSNNVPHGTWMTGIMGAEIDNEIGIAGVAPFSQFIIMKVMNDDGFGSSANHMPALEYILENKANNPGKRYIVNMSLSTGQTVSEDIADTLAAHNILLIASAGNTPSSYWTNSNDCFYKVTYPAAVASYSDNVISVSASDHKDFPVYNTRCANQIGEITVMAPAGAGGGPEYCNFDCAVITTSPIQHSANQTHTNTDYYRFAGNSSGAAAHVSGVAALVWSVNPNLTPSEIKQIIINSADKVPGMNGQNYHNRYGYGRVNAVRAVHLARRPMILELAQQRNSVDIDATGSNQGRRAVHDGSKLHIVFESDGEIFYYQRLSSGAFTDPVFLSDVQATLIGHNGNPSIALVSGSIHVTWSKKRYGFHDYVVMHKYSSDGGATWSPDEVVVQGLEQDSDPIPVLSSSVVSWSPHLLLTYKGSDGLYALSWNTSTKEFGPYSGSSTKIPYTNNTHTSPAVAGSYYGSVTRHHAVTSANGASIFYSMFTPSTGAWTIPVNLSSIVPGSASHLTPSISGDINGNVHLVWHRSTGSGQYQNVIYHRRKHTSDGTWPNQYWATYYQYQSRPSVRTNGSDAIMLFTAPFSSSNSVFKQNFTTWPSAGWSSPSLVSGNAQNASITLNGTSMGVWTAGSGNPFSVSTSSGTLSKESLGKPLEYIRSLSWIDGSGWGEIRFMEPQLEVDGRKIAVPWVSIHPDTTITMDNLSLFFRPDLTGLSSIELEEGSFVFGVEYLAGEEIGNDNTKLVFEVEGNAIYKQPMNKTGLRTYRLSTGAVSNDTPVRIALENVPEPATLVVGHLMSGKEGGGDRLASETENIFLNGSEDTPLQISLSASPNPFNPTTTIRFSLPTEQAVQLSVYDVLGRRVAVLVNDVRTAGEHTVVLSGAELSSGVYIYALKHDHGYMTGKILLVK